MNRWIDTFLAVLLSFVAVEGSAQLSAAASYGFRHLRMLYDNDSVDILVKSKPGDESVAKPLFFFCQGSLPIPLMIIYTDTGRSNIFGVFPFHPDSLINRYHLVIVGKPGIPLMVDQGQLNADFTYHNPAGMVPPKYVEKNRLDYYVARNRAVVSFLQQQPWVTKKQLILAGHSEGSTIAAKMAETDQRITALIYSGGNPMGRMMTIIERSREKETDSTSQVDIDMAQWRRIVADPHHQPDSSVDTYLATFQFSVPPIQYLEHVHIPVLVTYGSRDAGAPFNDYLQIKTIMEKRSNFCFKAYIGTEHNFFPVTREGLVNYDVFNWNKVAEDWRYWLETGHCPEQSGN